jgi:hypothetical protein
MKSPRLTKNAAGFYDLLIENGKVSWAEDGTQVAQHAMERVLIFKGELTHGDKLTTKANEGTDWYGIIFAMDKSRAEKELELKSRILETPGVESISEWSWTQSGHTVTIEAKVLTAYGEVSVSEDVTPL